jgi:hypothetical protein
LNLAAQYAAQGQDRAAEDALTRLAVLPGDGVFADLTRQTLAAHGPSVVDVCDAMYGAAAQGGRFGSKIDGYLMPGSYPVTSGPYPPNVCPLGELIANRVGLIDWPAANDPSDGLTTQGLRLVASQTLHLPGWDDPVWIGVLALNEPPVVAGMIRNGRWEYRVVGAFSSALGRASIASYSPSDGGPAMILVSAVYSEPVSKWVFAICELGQRLLAFERLPADLEDTSQIDAITHCGDLSEISLVTTDDRVRVATLIAEAVASSEPPAEPRPPWVSLEGLETRPAGEIDVFAYVYDLEGRVMMESVPEITGGEIAALIDYLPRDDSAARLLATHLSYLAGLNQELRGNEEAAVRHYVDVISEAPEAGWAWLAWARLEPASQ